MNDKRIEEIIRVVKENEAVDPYDCTWDLLKAISQAQAEVSFKVGKTAGVAETLIPSLKAIEASRKAGIKEVVEWGRADCDCGHNYISDRWSCPHCRQAKRKEWGIK